MKRLQIIIFCALCSLSALAQPSYSYRYWFDQQTQVETVSTTSAQLHIDADVSALSEGLHSLHLQVFQNDTLPSPIFSHNFIKVADAATLQGLKCFYTVDEDSYNVSEATSISGQAYHFALDMSQLTDGLHSLTYWLSNAQETMTNMRTTYFVKTAAGGNGIVQLQYWLNDRYSERQTVNYDPRQATVHVATTLNPEQLPIRSSNFKFSVESGQPYIYARNELNLMFIDANSRFANSVHEFVDTRTRELVQPIGEVEESQTFPKVTDDNIRWYTLTMSAGDTFSMRTSVTSTLQLFSPTAQEVYKAEGSASTVLGGCRLTETGTHYLAVHDASGNISNMELYVEKYRYLLGDVDCNERVESADVVALARILAGLQPCKNLRNADINGDNTVSIADLTLLVNRMKGGN